MQEQKSEKKIPHYLTIINTFFRWIVIATGVMVLVALLGIVLGAINYMGGPVTYSGWILASWFVGNVLLIVCVVLYTVFFINLVIFIWGDDSGVTVAGGLGIPLYLIVAGTLLYFKHLAWVSFISFFYPLELSHYRCVFSSRLASPLASG